MWRDVVCTQKCHRCIMNCQLRSTALISMWAAVGSKMRCGAAALSCHWRRKFCKVNLKMLSLSRPFLRCEVMCIIDSNCCLIGGAVPSQVVVLSRIVTFRIFLYRSTLKASTTRACVVEPTVLTCRDMLRRPF